MKRLLLCIGLFTGFPAISQTTIFQDNFESGGGNWTMNSNDLSGGATSNHWVINNSFTGGSGSFICMTFPFSFTVGATPSQPGGISPSNANYMHISSLAGETSGLTNANFIAADGLCNFDESNFTKMTNAVSTLGFSNVTLSYWQLVGGESGFVSGEVYYSLDNGATWVLKTGNIVGVTTWTNNTLTDPAWDNVASLKIAFRFLNTVGSAPIDPSFSIDDVHITGTSGAVVTISTGTIPPTTYCLDNMQIVVPFTVTGTVTAGNVYTAQLSNSSGSFASPTVIGTMSSTSTGILNMLTMIPNGTPAGNGYRIRVNASSPATIGTDNGSNLTLEAKPVISVSSIPANATICSGNSASLTVTGATSYDWLPSGSLSSATGSNVTATPTSTQVYTVLGTTPAGCSDTLNFTVTVQSCAGLEEESFGDFELYPNPVNQLLHVNFGELTDVQTVSVLDLSGRKVFTDKIISQTIDVSVLESGKYFLVIEHAAGVPVKAFVKQ
jgi:hypothetical protein